MKAFLTRKGVTLSWRSYFITALSYMALGLFSSLIIGLIIKTVGEELQWEPLIEMGSFAMQPEIWGGAIGVAIAYGLNAPPLVVFAALFSGAFSASVGGGPAGSYIAALCSIEIGKLVSKETKLDILITPFVTIVVGFVIGFTISPSVHAFMTGFGDVVIWATERQPFVMGILVAVLMGWALTAPISSVAIAIMIDLEGVAAGAATVGCAAQMIGFGVMSYRENGIGGLFAQGIGTSMLQVANIVKKPILIIPPTIAGALLAPIATMGWLGTEMVNNDSGAGMGTSGFVGQIMTIQTMGFTQEVLISILLLHIIGPALITLILSEWFRKKGWIQLGDLKIDY
ncbi:PTS transporter subunit IIC [Pontibacillus litoralis]|uniref:PTS sugar transporter subunit IID n=1 Tax=Pontibacillus litoralis JSM 072002 TaxID=1385512 RepID=A0A0A5HZX3_9BACI|nr:PTS sugar transporter subunit IIC [Pontibacillus litoralis]KGX89157.1 PTS sugar transporter subunit IID [Pontibacillus litoralis JSM 072002]